MFTFRSRIARSYFAAICFIYAGIYAGRAFAGAAEPQAVELMAKISQKFKTAQPYAIEGSFEAARHMDEDPKEALATAKFTLLTAPGMKYRLHAEMAGGAPSGEFDSVSDGKKTWTYLASKEYVERSAARDADPAGQPDLVSRRPEPRALIEDFALQIVPMLANLPNLADIAFLRGRLLTVISKKDANGVQNLLYITIDSSTLAISNLAFTRAFPVKDGKMLVRYDVSFKKLSVAEPVSDSQFTFVPPAGAKLSASLPAYAPEAPSPALKKEPAAAH